MGAVREGYKGLRCYRVVRNTAIYELANYKQSKVI